jgi:hypothetical protein
METVWLLWAVDINLPVLFDGIQLENVKKFVVGAIDSGVHYLYCNYYL